MTETAVVEYRPDQLLAMAVQNNLDVDKLERLMDLQQRWSEQQARKAFYAAMAQFQNLVPELIKTKTVSFNEVFYSYAPLPEIVDQIKGPLKECGLTYRWEFTDEGGDISVTCIITHIDGHSEETTMSAPADESGRKNLVQQRGSTITYLQRYTLIGALGLATADSDTDGRTPQNTDLIGFGKHKDKKWSEVSDTYLKTLISKTTNDNYRRFAQAEIDRRQQPEEISQEVESDLTAEEIALICRERYGEEDSGKLEPDNGRDFAAYLREESLTRKLDDQVDKELSAKMCQALFGYGYFDLTPQQMKTYRGHLEIYLNIKKSQGYLSDGAYNCVYGEWRNRTGVDFDGATTEQLIFLLQGLRKAYKPESSS